MSSEETTQQQRRSELARLRAQAEQLDRQIRDLEGEVEPERPHADWRDRGDYFTYYATTGFFLGMAGALASLLFNVVGAVAVGKNPLWLIQVYLTFGVGKKAITDSYDDSLALLIGCCLYVATGMVYGVPFQLAMPRLAPKGDLLTRLLWASALGLALWIVNYYAILTWLQPLLFGGRWIVDEVPWYVGAGTHLVFAWTMAVLYPYGAFAPYRISTEPQ